MECNMQKTEVQGIYKVSEGVLINKDNEALIKYKKKRDLIKNKDEKLNILETQVNDLSHQMTEIKELLMKALTK